MSNNSCPKISIDEKGKITITGLSIFRGSDNIVIDQEEYLMPRNNMEVWRIDNNDQAIIALSTPMYDIIFIRIIGGEVTYITYPSPIKCPDGLDGRDDRFKKGRFFFTFKIDDGAKSSTSTRLCPQTRQKTLDRICEKLAEPEPKYEIDRPVIEIKSHTYKKIYVPRKETP